MLDYEKIGDCTLYFGDCLDVMPQLDVKVDMVLADPPYGITQNKWDSVISLADMWAALQEITTNHNTPIVMTAAQPFTSTLGASNIGQLRYSWVWEKPKATGHLNAKKMPLKNHEDVLVFADTLPLYHPQGLEPYGKMGKRGGNGKNYGKSGLTNFQEFTNYPKSILQFKSDPTVHPTQKPVALMEYLIRTYTNEGDTVLDFTMGSGTTGVACVNTNRKFIGIELDAKYFDIASDRIEAANDGR